MVNTKTKIKLSAIFILSIITLFGFFIAPAQTFAATCNSVTLTGNVITGVPPARARFTYSTNYNTVANGQGTQTTTQTFYSDGPIKQFISGLSQNTTYYYRLEVTSNYGAAATDINNFTTSKCATPGAFIAVNQQPTVVLYSDKTSVFPGGAVTIRWLTTNATFCNASLGSSGWEGSKNAFSGSFYTGPLTSSATYIITCGNNFRSVTDSVSVAISKQKQALEIQAPKTITQTWTEPINTVIAPSEKTFLGASVLETGFLPTNIFGWLFLIILLLILIFLIRHALE